ncbi:spermidine synthase, partial [Elusimicrobiota bacterium]
MQLFGLSLGNSVFSTAIVLSSFMGGLALGNLLITCWGYKIRSPLRFYAFLEIMIGVSTLALVLSIPIITVTMLPIYRLLLNNPVLLNTFRTAVSFFLMLFVTTAMGATLPVFVKVLYTKNRIYGRILGSLYGCNTMGAVFGLIITEVFLVKYFGLTGTAAIAAGFNLLAAITILIISGKHSSTYTLNADSDPAAAEKINRKTIKIIITSFFSGFVLLALEIVWFRFMCIFYPGYSMNFTIMLATVLGGISLGGLFASSWIKKNPHAHHNIPVVFIINSIAIIILYTLFALILEIAELFFSNISIFISSLFLMFPVSFISGILFTLLGKTLHISIKSGTRTTGLLSLSNTTGSMLGALFSGLFAISHMGIEKSFFLYAFIYMVMAFITFDKNYFIPLKKRILYPSILLIILSILMLSFPFGLMENHYSIVKSPFIKNDEKRTAYKETLTEIIQYFRKDLLGEPYYYRLVTNTYSMSTTRLKGKRYMKLFVYLPMAVLDEPKNALLLCYGCANTAKALTETESLETI